MPLHLIRNDITRMAVDAIVNAANERLAPGGGVCGAIFSAAGFDQLNAACRAIGHCDTGSAVMTPGFDLPARHVIHTVGPVWRGGGHNEEALLASCYRSSMTLAAQQELQSVAFPLISGGIYGYPRAEAMRVAVSSIRSFLVGEAHEDMDVYLVLYSREAFTAGSAMYGGIRSYISDAQVLPDERLRQRRDAAMLLEDLEGLNSAPPPMAAAPKATKPSVHAKRASAPMDVLEAEQHVAYSAHSMDDEAESQLKGWMRRHLHRETTFAEHLFQLIDRSGEKDAAIYKRANLDRRLFSKIRSNMGYQPSKSTVLALCLALRLPRAEADVLLGKAGYALTPANQRDLAVIWCMEHGCWDVYELNMVLFDLDLPGLGA